VEGARERGRLARFAGLGFKLVEAIVTAIEAVFVGLDDVQKPGGALRNIADKSAHALDILGQPINSFCDPVDSVFAVSMHPGQQFDRLRQRFQPLVDIHTGNILPPLKLTRVTNVLGLD
jgi:hypothetical protein